MAEALSEEDAEEEREALPCTPEEVLTFDFTGDGRDEIFVYVESFDSFWNNDGAVYILSPAEEGGYMILRKIQPSGEGIPTYWCLTERNCSHWIIILLPHGKTVSGIIWGIRKGRSWWIKRNLIIFTRIYF